MEPFEVIPPEWRPDNRYITRCARCGAEVLKRNAVALYTLKRGQSMRLLMHLCPTCYANHLDDYGMGE